jgi:hypothetical protein
MNGWAMRTRSAESFGGYLTAKSANGRENEKKRGRNFEFWILNLNGKKFGCDIFDAVSEGFFEIATELFRYSAYAYENFVFVLCVTREGGRLDLQVLRG